MRVFSRASILAIENRAIGGDQHAAFELMKRAGFAAYQAMLKRFHDVRRIQVLCGSGNNAGDGYVFAALAQADAAATGKSIEIVRIGRAPKPDATVWNAFEMAMAAGVPVRAADALSLQSDLLVDALLGTGVKGAPRPEYAAAIEKMNNAKTSVLSLDIPSGMNPDTGAASGIMVRADLTVSFIGAKRGMLTGAGKAATGTLIVDRLGLSAAEFKGHTGHTLLGWAQSKSALSRLDPNAHKHSLGHVLVIGGDHGMGGAVVMAAEGALRVGTGVVTLATRPEHTSATLARLPEVMILAMGHTPNARMGHTQFKQGQAPPETGQTTTMRLTQGQSTLMEKGQSTTAKFNAVVVGPGLGRADWGKQLLDMAGDTGLPMLVDGDGLSLLQDPPRNLRVITPHPGEAARLLGRETCDVNRDRFSAVQRLADAFGAVALLKGAGSLIATPGGRASDIDICAEGNPGMATAGSGDVLAGIIGGFLAQGLSPLEATRSGTCLHAAAGDLAARDLGQRSLKATDILARIPELLRELD